MEAVSVTRGGFFRKTQYPRNASNKMVYIITGGPGFGKTTLLNLLAERQFPVCQENVRALLSPDTNSGIPADFERTIATERAYFLASTPPSTVAFSDRGLPDQVAYSWYKKKEPSAFILEMVNANSYAPIVFLTPPWKDIFVADRIRQESFEQSVAIHEEIVRAYLKFQYKIINLPLVNPVERVQFILNFLGI